MKNLVLDNALVRDYKQQLENLLPSEIDGLESEGEMMVQYVYVRDSIEFKGLVGFRDTDPLTPHISIWEFTVRSAWAPHDQMFVDLFIPSTGLRGIVHVPIDSNNELILDDVDFLGGLRMATVSYKQCQDT